MTIKPFIILLLLSAATTAKAQQGNAEIGIEAGAGGRYISSNGWKYGVTGAYSFGINFQYKLSTLFSLRTNLHLERKGTLITNVSITDEQGNPLGQTDMRANLDYLTLPVMLRLSLGRQVKFFVNAGPYFGLLISESYLIETPEKRIKRFAVSDYDDIDFGLASGVGLAIPLTEKWNISLETRYNLGLFNINKGNHLKWSNHSAVALLGFSYKL